MKKLFLLIVLISSVFVINAQEFDYKNIKSHPRILLADGEENLIKNTINEDVLIAKVHQQIIDLCDKTIDEPPVERIKEGKRLLAISRIALKRIFYLSYAYRITGNEQYAARAEKEMLAVSRFTDWNPTHFLDVGEMVMGLAIGYDWLYSYLQPCTKEIVKEAILEKGFKASEHTKNAWFYNTNNNWNSVCNAGLVYGALALFDEAPKESRAIIEKCMETNPKAMHGYGPDGGYPEGFGYWGYGTSFQGMLIAALESAFGTDLNLSKAPGFLESAEFMQFMTAPSGDSYCFSDSPIKAESNMIMYWFAKKNNDPSLLWIERQYLKEDNMRFAEDRLLPILMIFASQFKQDEIKAPTRNFWFNRGDTPIFIYREGWNSASDAYLGVKGGSPQTSHAHMDAGSFVYEKNGVRWAMDLGMQSYITLESKGVDLWNQKQDGQRWDVFRLANIAHGTLTINGERHLVDSHAAITKTFESKKKKGAEIDLSSVFANSVNKSVREVSLDSKNNLTVRDYIETGDKTADITWVMVTPAEAKVVGQNSIELTKNGKKMLLEIVTKQKVDLKIWSNEPHHDYDFKNPGTIRVGFEVKVPQSSKTVFEVKLTSL